MSKIMSAALAAAAMLAAGAASAAAAKAPTYADLDLGRPSDARTYRARVARAVDAACEGGGGFNVGQQAFECRTRTQAAIMAAMPDEVRTVYLAALNGQASDVLSRQRLAAAPSGAVNRE